MFRKAVLATAVLAVALVTVLRLGIASGADACTTNVTPTTFASAVSAAKTGDTLCLASGSYGTWSGTNKAITLTAASGATPTMKASFGSSASGFTLDGMGGMGGTATSTTNVTVRNSTFTSSLDFEGSNHGFVLDHNVLDWPAKSGGINAKVFFGNSNSGTVAAPAVTVSNNHIAGGDLDGVHIGGGSGLVIDGNEFANLCDVGQNHTDNIQFEGGSQVLIQRNYVHEANGCGTQGITSYDGGTNSVVIQDNVVDIPRDWGIELYQDHGSSVLHNTVVHEPYSSFGSGTGHIDIGHKTSQACGSGTVVRDNVATAGGTCPLTADHNTNPATVTYVGPTNTWAGHQLAAGSPGKGAASDGSDTGIRVSSPAPTPTPTPTDTPTPTPTPTDTPTPTPTPTDTPTPTPTPTPPSADTPAQAQWTAPTGATVGNAVTLDGTSSTGDAPLSCAWQFEDSTGATIQTRTGCKITFTFSATGTKYVTLIVADTDGDLSARRRTFTVS